MRLISVAAITLALAGNALAQSGGAGNMPAYMHGHDTMTPTVGAGAKMGHGGLAEDHMEKRAGHSHGSREMTGVEIPADLDTATRKLSALEHYRVSMTAESPPVVINTLHRWILEITTPDCRPVDDATVTVDGGMPAHGHGLPTAPRVTEYLGDGRYLVEGVRFNMAGWWQITIAIDSDHRDSASFNIVAH